MSAARCVIIFSEVAGPWGTPAYAQCLKDTIKHPAVLPEIAELDDDTQQTIEDIGLRGEYTAREQKYLRDVLLTIADLPLD